MQLEDLALTIKEIFPDLDSSLIVKIVGETNDPETAFSKAEDADVQLKYGGVQIDDWVMEDVKVQHKYGEDEEWNFDWVPFMQVEKIQNIYGQNFSVLFKCLFFPDLCTMFYIFASCLSDDIFKMFIEICFPTNFCDSF